MACSCGDKRDERGGGRKHTASENEFHAANAAGAAAATQHNGSRSRPTSVSHTHSQLGVGSGGENNLDRLLDVGHRRLVHLPSLCSPPSFSLGYAMLLGMMMIPMLPGAGGVHCGCRVRGSSAMDRSGSARSLRTSPLAACCLGVMRVCMSFDLSLAVVIVVFSAYGLFVS